MTELTSREALARTLLLCRDFVTDEVADDDILVALRTTTVCIVADARSVSTAAGQSAIVTLSVLVVQMGCELRLALPEAMVRGHQPPLRGELLRAGLLDLTADLVPDACVRVVEHSTDGDLVFVMGNTPWAGAAGIAWRLGWTRWSGSMAPATATVQAVETAFPIGALASAAIAAAEPFKYAIRTLALRDRVLDQLALTREAHVRLADEDVAPEGRDLGRIDCVSAGALTQAFLHGLFRVPDIRCSLRTIEPETLDGTNLNRYALARRSQVGLSKSAIVGAALPPGVSIVAATVRLDETTLPTLNPLAPTVVVGTDNVPSRWLVQGAHPDWVAIGATDHFLAMTSEHFPGVGCGRCLHDRDDGVVATIPTVSHVSYWGGLMLAARVLRRAARHPLGSCEQVTMLWTLQLGSRSGLPRYDVVPRPGCALGCWRRGT